MEDWYEGQVCETTVGQGHWDSNSLLLDSSHMQARPLLFYWSAVIPMKLELPYIPKLRSNNTKKKKKHPKTIDQYPL